MTLAQTFQDLALTQCTTAQMQLGISLTRLHQTITQRGGAETVQELIRRGRLSDGFTALKTANRLDLTLEAAVIRREFATLFTDDEVNACYEVLVDVGYYG